MKELFYNKEKKYIITKLSCNSKEELLSQLGGVLEDKGYVKDTYVDAILEREKIFPTGLPTAGVAVAIPHTDSIHVNYKSICIGILEKPVTFTVMATDDEFIDVGLVFMLAIKEPSHQIDLLQNLISLCQDEDLLLKISDGKDLDFINETIKGIL